MLLTAHTPVPPAPDHIDADAYQISSAHTRAPTKSSSRMTVGSSLECVSFAPIVITAGAMSGPNSGGSSGIDCNLHSEYEVAGAPAYINDDVKELDGLSHAFSRDDAEHRHTDMAVDTSELSESLVQSLASRACFEGFEEQSDLQRRGTLISTGAHPARKAAELKNLLGNCNAMLKPGAVVVSAVSGPARTEGIDETDPPDTVVLEGAKARARVDVDIILSSDCFVQGQCLSGQVLVRVRKCSKKESRVLLAEGKVRVLGFECLPDGMHRHLFYQYTRRLEEVSYAGDQIFAECAEDGDEEGFRLSREGVHVLPFEMDLPVEGEHGNAKGAIDVHGGIAIRYIAMVSIKVKDQDTSECSLAHFYRSCNIWPHLSMQNLLAPAPRPLIATANKSLLFGGRYPSNRLKLTARLPRLTYLSGQRCYVQIRVVNDTRRVVRGVMLVLMRKTTAYKPLQGKNTSDAGAYKSTVFEKELVESRLEIGEHGTKGHASAKGWWTGVGPDADMEFQHSILIPSDALSISRSRLLAVDYSIRVTISASSCAPGFTSDVSVMLPIRIASMISIDPPPSQCAPHDVPFIDGYTKTVEAAEVDVQDPEAEAGTLPSYRSRAPSISARKAFADEVPQSASAVEQPPYYKSNLANAASSSGSHVGRGPGKQGRPLVVANPSSPEAHSTFLSLSERHEGGAQHADIFPACRSGSNLSGREGTADHDAGDLLWREDILFRHTDDEAAPEDGDGASEHRDAEHSDAYLGFAGDRLSRPLPPVPSSQTVASVSHLLPSRSCVIEGLPGQAVLKKGPNGPRSSLSYSVAQTMDANTTTDTGLIDHRSSICEHDSETSFAKRVREKLARARAEMAEAAAGANPDSESTSGRLRDAPASVTESAYTRQLQRPSPTRATNDSICENHIRSIQTQLLPTGNQGDHLLTARKTSVGDTTPPKRPPSTPTSRSGSVRDRVMMLEERTRAEMDSP